MLEISLSVGVVLVCLIVTIVGTRHALRSDRHDRANDNVMTAGIRLAGAAFVFLAAFAGYSQWQTIATQESSFRAEFAAVADLYRLAPPGVEGEEIRVALLEYATEVRASPLDESAGKSALSVIEAASERPIGASISGQMVDATMNLADSREMRDLLPDSGVPWVVHGAVFILGLASLVLAAFYPAGTSRGLKWLQAMSAAAVIGTIMVTLILLEAPALEEDRLQPGADFMLEQMTGVG